MKKLLLILGMCMCLNIDHVQAQNAYYDALYLAQNKANIALLDKYKNMIEFTPQEQEQINLVTNFLKKPFSIYQHKLNFNVLKVVLKKLETSPKGERPQTVDGALPGIGSLIPSSFKKFSNFSGVKNADFYQGISKYIAAEFKKGVTLSFFEAFEKTLSNVGELQILFPVTFQALKTRDPFRFPELGTHWKEIFHQDLQNIVRNFVQYVENPNSEAASKALFLTSSFAESLKKNPQYQYLRLGDDIASKLINKFHPVDLMNYLDLKYFQNPNGNYRAVGSLLHKLNVVQTNLRDTTGNTWINFEQFNRLNSAQMGIFAGLLYQKSPQVFADMKRKVSFNNEAHPAKSKRYLLENILPVYEGLIKIQEFEKSKGKSLYDQDYSTYMQHFANLLQTADRKLMAKSVLNPPETDGNSTLGSNGLTNNNILQKTLNVYKSIHQKEYNNLIPNLSKILLQMLNQSEQNTSFAKMLSKLDRYGSFMIGVVNAKDVNQMRDLIGRVIATSSSYLKKRTSLRTLSITAHAGYYASAELLEKTNTWGVNTGLTVPLGLEYTIGFTSRRKPGRASKDYFTKNNQQRFYRGSSLGLFLQIIDLGAMMNYRLFDEQSQTLPDELSFNQLLAPGASINYGFKNNPLTIGVGYQYAPQTRRVTDSVSNRPVLSNAHRVFLRISWDLSLLHIWAKKP